MYGKTSVSFEIPSTIRGSVTAKQDYLLGWTDCANYDYVILFYFFSQKGTLRCVQCPTQTCCSCKQTMTNFITSALTTASRV